MATHLIKKVATNPAIWNNTLTRLQIIRSAGYWNKDWKPASYPQTESEKIAAAKKYGLLPQDYEPYPDDGYGYGDYPKLPLVSTDMKDPFHNWDFPDQKRNYGEPLHVDYDAYTEERVSNAKMRYSFKEMWATTLGVIGTAAAIYLLFEYKGWRVSHPWTPKQYPVPGKTHYTFEPVD